MKRVLLTGVVLVLASAAGAREWVPLEPGARERPAEFRVLSSNSRRCVVELEIAGIYVDEAREAGQVFQAIELGIARGGMTVEEGAPRLPLVARFLKVPDDRAVEARVLELEETTLTGYNVVPAQPPLPEDRASVPFVINRKAYETDGLYPVENCRTSEPMIMRDHRLVQLVLQPLRCNPVRQELSVARRLRVELRFEGPGQVNVKRRFRNTVSRAFEPLYRLVIANYGFEPPQRPEDGSYLIITHDDFAGAVEPFAEWKHQRGWRTKVVTTTEIGGNDSAHINAYIADAYNNWPEPPDYVLLVGDAPGYVRCCHQTSGGYAASDLPYSCQEGTDILADLMIGRVSVETVTEARAALNKLYRSEREPYMANTDWYGKVCALAAYEGSPRFWSVVIRIRNYVMGRPFGQFDTLFERWDLNTARGLTDSLNLGRSWMLYRGHGLKTGWDNVDPSWGNQDVFNLANLGMTPIVIGPTCDAGDFDYSTMCHAEAWLRAGTPDSARGGLGYFGSSEPSYSGYNDTLALGCFMSYVDSLLFTFGQCTQFGKLLMLEAYPLPDPTAEKEVWMFNNIGEPELNLWSDVPAGLAVEHPATVIIGQFPFPVTVSSTDGPVEDALVCVMSRLDSTIYHVGYTDAAGQVQFTIAATQPGDSVRVTVTGRNLHPYLGAAMTISPNSAYVTHLRHTVNDSVGGNGDGVINPGETVVMPVWVRNWGSLAADSVVGTLRTADPNVTLLDSVKGYGTVAPDDSAWTGPGGYGFAVASSCTNRYRLAFDLVCQDDNDSVWVSGINLWVGTPDLAYVGHAVDDPPPGGNGDGKIDPGETARIAVTLANAGLGHGYNVRAVLRSGDARFHVLDSAGEFGTIRSDTTGSNEADPFQVMADDSVPMETPVSCTLHLAADGYVGTVAFTIVVGEIRAIDPIPDGPREPPVYWAYDNGDSGYTQAPEFSWIEISGVGTRLTLSDDQTVRVPIPLEFGPFVYYGQTYTDSISICGNGWVAPGRTTYSGYSNTQLPYASGPPMVALNWDDLYPPTGGGIWYHHDTARHALVVEWDSVHYYSPRDQWDRFELVVFDTTVGTPTGDNVVLAQYRTGNGYSSSTIGLQDHTRTVAIQCLYNSAYHRGALPLDAGSAIKYTPVGPMTGLEEGRRSVLALGGTEFGVWPNPARSLARVSFGLEREGRVSLKVFDQAGRQVASLLESRLRPGRYSVYWDRHDDQGRRLAQGVYFLRLDADAGRLVDKLVLLK